MSAAIVGVGMHPFGRFGDKSAIEMGVDAARAALADAGAQWKDVDLLLCGHMYAGTGAGHHISTQLGATGIPIMNLENACSSGGAALRTAVMAVSSGMAEVVLVVGIEKMPRGFMDMNYFEPWRRASGRAVNPAQFAYAIRRHMHEHGTTEHQLALVSVKNHANGVHNPNALFRKAVSAEEVMSSRSVCDPLRLLMLCSPDEGAAAALVTSTRGARRFRPDWVTIAGTGLATARYDQSIGEHMPTCSPAGNGSPSATRRAAQQAYEAAGIGPDELDFAEVQDTDSGTEIISCEQLGLCAVGEGGAMVESGASWIGGRLPVNPSGGLLSRGEPVGASGLGQVAETVWQLRGCAGPRQVEGARVALTHTLGAGGNACVIILKADNPFTNGATDGASG
jgi:acetyl-CoA acetyltransferase